MKLDWSRIPSMLVGLRGWRRHDEVQLDPRIGPSRRGRLVVLPEFQAPKLHVKGHEAFVRATGWTMRRWDWEVIRVKVGAEAVVVQKRAVQVQNGRIGPGEYMMIEVPGLDTPARYAAGLYEFREAFGMPHFGPGSATEAHWKEMFRRVGEDAFLVLMAPSETHHGVLPKT